MPQACTAIWLKYEQPHIAHLPQAGLSESWLLHHQRSTAAVTRLRVGLFKPDDAMVGTARAAEGDLSLYYYAVAVSGALFDSSGMPNRFLRPLADTWGHWSIRWCWRLGKAWRAACMLRNVPVDGA